MPRGLSEVERRVMLAELRAVAEGQGGQCLSESYLNSKTPLRWKCSEGHTWDATPRNVVHSGTWCPHCAMTRRNGPRLR